ncbi:MAG: proton-conducting transporter membrane subunit, partial [Cyanobacteria bacterium J06641_5]
MISTNFPWLSAAILLPLAAAFLVPLFPEQQVRSLRVYALGTGVGTLVLTLVGFWTNFNLDNPDFQLVESYAWVPQIGLNWSVGVDGLSMPLIVLSGLVTALALLASWRVERKPKLFYFLMLVLLSAQIGVFAARDLLMFFFMWELELVPVYLLISIWGGKDRFYAATKFILYTALGSVFILVSALAMAFYGDNFTFDMAELGAKNYPTAIGILAYVGFLIAYGVKLPIFP